MLNETKLREIALAEVDAELDTIGPHDKAKKFDEWDSVAYLREELDWTSARGKVYGRAKHLAAQAIRLMIDSTR